jgi:hypothetical protein
MDQLIGMEASCDIPRGTPLSWALVRQQRPA